MGHSSDQNPAGIRLMYLELATQWRELAESIETPDTPGGATIH
jgi:hypothetical protein